MISLLAGHGHGWTSGQAERTVRTLKNATVHAFHDATIRELRRHIANWLAACTSANQLKALELAHAEGNHHRRPAAKAWAFHPLSAHDTPGPYNWAMELKALHPVVEAGPVDPLAPVARP